MTTPSVAVWAVDPADQAAFAGLSGDHNPLHVDPIAARRLPFGRVAVHGVHLLLDTLERIAATGGGAPRRIRCTFRHSVGVDDEIATAIDASDPADVRATVTVDVWTAAEMRVELGTSLPDVDIEPSLPPRAQPEVHTIDELVGFAGTIALAADIDAAIGRFPHLHQAIGTCRLAALISLTRLVGMHVPGLHSLLSRLDVSFGDMAAADELRVVVARTDDRFSQVVLDVAGATMAATVTAFIRAAPVDQELGGVRPDVDEFAGERWLVVGGSRGLGAVAVELLAAGGADVRFTYLAGADDAERITARLPGVTAHRLDVLAPDLASIAADGWRPSHLAYMATPPIFDGVGGTYSDRLHQRFRAVYVEAFVRLVDDLGPEQLAGILWPSSEAVDREVAGLAEYADAKREGERACVELAATHPTLRVHAPRLPRLLTDQSTSVVPTEFGDTATEVLRALRGLH